MVVHFVLVRAIVNSAWAMLKLAALFYFEVSFSIEHRTAFARQCVAGRTLTIWAACVVSLARAFLSIFPRRSSQEYKTSWLASFLRAFRSDQDRSRASVILVLGMCFYCRVGATEACVLIHPSMRRAVGDNERVLFGFLSRRCTVSFFLKQAAESLSW